MKKIMFLYTRNKQLEIESKWNNNLHSIRKYECLLMSLTKGIQDLHTENYKTLFR